MARCLLLPARRLLLLLLALGVLGTPAILSAAPPAELILRGVVKPADDDEENAAKKPPVDENLLPPTASFELRFANAMVAADQIGKEATDSPLVFTPALPGAFRWTSQRAGVYTLMECPPLSANYDVTVRAGLKDASGKPVAGLDSMKRSFHTPGLELTAVVTNGGDSNDLPARPRVDVLCNSAVSPTKVQPAFSFVGPDGKRITAKVRAVEPGGAFASFGQLSPRTWREQFMDAHAPADAVATPGSTDSRNRLEISPNEPLTVGKDWKLVADAGIAGEDPGAKRLTPFEVVIGEVKPLTVSRLAADNNGEDDRKLVITFSKKLSPDVTNDTAGKYIHVSPEAANMKFDVGSGEVVTISGDFALDKDYLVTVDDGTPANEGMKLAAAFAENAKFEKRAPTLAFPDFAVQQLGAGRREWDLFAVNVPEVRLRIKVVPPEQAPAALAQYQTQYYDPSEGHTERNHVNFDKAPGKVVYDQKIKGSQTVDKPETIRLKWDELLGAGKNGVLLLEAEQQGAAKGQKRVGVQALVQVTNLGMVWQLATGDKLRAFVFSLTDAAPAGKATVRVFGADGKPLKPKAPSTASATADTNGLTALAIDPADVGWLEAVSGDDCLVIQFATDQRASGEVGLYGFHLPPTAYANDNNADNAESDDADAGPKKPAVKRDVLVFSDRGVYKPGETVNFKAIVREWRDGGLVNAATDTPVTIRAFDARGRKFFQKTAKLTAAGSLSEAIVLPKTSVGHYRAEIVFDNDPPDATDSEDLAAADNSDDDDTSNDNATPTICRFQVQEFQANAFEVKLAKPTNPTVGEGVTPLSLAAKYYMGTALSRAKVVWSLKAVDTQFTPAGYEDYVFGSNDLDYRLRRQRGELALDGEAALSDKGELTLSPNIVLNHTIPSPRFVRVQASVTDQDQQTVTANKSYTVNSSDFYFGLREMPDVVKAGDPLPLEVIAVNAADNQPRAKPVHVTAKLSHIEWRTQRVATENGDSDYDSTPHLEPVGSATFDTITLQNIGGRWEPATDTPAGLGSLVPKEPGEYLIEINGTDDAGRAIATSTTVDVLGDKEAEWGYRNAWQIQLVPDKAEYHAGDKATILVQTPISGRALVSVEREGVARSFVTELHKEHPAIEVPITDTDAPNTFVSVVLLRGVKDSSRRIKMPEYRAGFCQLNVPKTDSHLTVEVKPKQADYQPGTDVVVDVNVTDEAHKPAPGSEVTLYAVDKGVLSLTGYELPGIWKAFYHDRPLDVHTGVTLPALLSEDPADMEFAGEKGEASNKGYLIGGGGEDSLRERLRQNFVACAYWNATLVTDAQGHVEAHFTAPDNLTEFQVMAIVHEGGHDKAAAGRFGGGQSSFRINKPLMLEPALPRFANVGDHITLRAVVHNQSPNAGDVDVTLELDDKAAIDANNGGEADAKAKRIHLDAGESRPVEFPVEFRKTGVAKWTWRASLNSAAASTVSKDSVQSTLNVDHPTPLRAEVAYQRPTGSMPDLLGHVDPSLLEGEDGLITVSVSSSRLSELNGGIDSLLHYPYGCIEQTVSSTLPWLVFKDFHDVLPEMNKTPAEAEDAAMRGINRILGMQTEDGGLAYWPSVTGRVSHPWGSAYGALGLALAREAGFFVPQANVDKLTDYLSKSLRTEEEPDASTAAHDRYHDHNETDRCLALYALALLDKPEAAYCEQMYKQRDKLCPEDRTLVALALLQSKGDANMVRELLKPGPRETEKPESWNPFASSAALDGMRLMAAAMLGKDSSLDGRVTRLLGERNRTGDWGTTQGNAWAMLGMAQYATKIEKAAGPASGSVAVAGQTRAFHLGGDKRTFTCEFPLEALSGGSQKLALTNGDAKRVLYIQAKVASRPRGGAGVNSTATNGSGGYILQRSYQKVQDDGSVVDLAAGKLKVGDRVLVSLDVQVPASAGYVAIDDPLPSVLEAINPDFKTAGAGGNAPADGSMEWVADYRELRESRALFFCNSLAKGRYHLTYLARVRAAGTVTAPSAKIEEMYHPENYAETAAGKMTTGGME